MSTILGGRTQQIHLKVYFDIVDDVVDEFEELVSVYRIVGETGKGITHKEYDMDYIAETHGELLIRLIMGNPANWNCDDIWYTLNKD